MAVNQSGIAISIKAFLPTGKTLDEAFNALSLVKAAHESGDYTALLAAAQIDEIKTEQKTRRIEIVDITPQEAKEMTAEQLQATTAAIEPDLTPLPETAPMGEPSLQDVADYGTDDGAGLAVVEDSRPLPWADTPAQAEPEPEAKPKRTKKGE